MAAAVVPRAAKSSSHGFLKLLLPAISRAARWKAALAFAKLVPVAVPPCWEVPPTPVSTVLHGGAPGLSQNMGGSGATSGSQPVPLEFVWVPAAHSRILPP